MEFKVIREAKSSVLSRFIWHVYKVGDGLIFKLIDCEFEKQRTNKKTLAQHCKEGKNILNLN